MVPQLGPGAILLTRNGARDYKGHGGLAGRHILGEERSNRKAKHEEMLVLIAGGVSKPRGSARASGVLDYARLIRYSILRQHLRLLIRPGQIREPENDWLPLSIKLETGPDKLKPPPIHSRYGQSISKKALSVGP